MHFDDDNTSVAYSHYRIYRLEVFFFLLCPSPYEYGTSTLQAYTQAAQFVYFWLSDSGRALSIDKRCACNSNENSLMGAALLPCESIRFRKIVRPFRFDLFAIVSFSLSLSAHTHTHPHSYLAAGPFPARFHLFALNIIERRRRA